MFRSAQAAREYYSIDFENRTCWNGLYRENLRGEFNVPRGTKDTVIFDDDDFAAVSEALASTKIMAGDFEKVLNGVREDDFVFIDPPYTVKHNGNGFVKYNESIFSWNDQVRLATAVKSKARSGASILVTNAYHPTVVDLYRDFAKVVPVERASILSGDKSYRGKTQEALILVGSPWKERGLESMLEPATIRYHQLTS
jgi:DNA adenine methylase